MIKWRIWLKNLVLGFVGVVVFFLMDLKVFEEEINLFFKDLEVINVDEKYWKKIKWYFVLVKDLWYFNNGFLGICLDYVVDVINKFCSMLDFFF